MKRPNALLIFAILFMIFLYGPVLLMPVFSLNDSTFATFPLKGFTTRHYGDMLANTSMMLSLKNSLVVGSLVSVHLHRNRPSRLYRLDALPLARRRPHPQFHDAATHHSLHRHIRGPAGHHPALSAH